jgi:hypothetical protein
MQKRKGGPTQGASRTAVNSTAKKAKRRREITRGAGNGDTRRDSRADRQQGPFTADSRASLRSSQASRVPIADVQPGCDQGAERAKEIRCRVAARESVEVMFFTLFLSRNISTDAPPGSSNGAVLGARNRGKAGGPARYRDRSASILDANRRRPDVSRVRRRGR